MISISVVVPCYRVKDHILTVLKQIGPEVQHIYCVDDACPEKTGDFIESQCQDQRVKVIRHPHNQGVGGAILTGYKTALSAGTDIIVKVDGDGQMDPRFIPKLIAPILSQTADYTKANRFYNLEFVESMPFLRKLGNAILSFMSKFSTGYWDIFDPTNGFTAIHAKVAEELDFEKIAKRYFFETDILFRLNIIRAVVRDIPFRAHYGSEKSNLKIRKVWGEFLIGHCRNFCKRLIYNYFLRNFTLGSLEIIAAPILLLGGGLLGSYEWYISATTGRAASAGIVMFSAMPTLLGIHLFLAFFNHDMQNTPRYPLHPYLKKEPLI